MPRSQAQSDFSVTRAPEVQLPAAAALASLPRAAGAAAQAGEFATRWILRLTVLLLALLAVLCLVGPHIPAGE